MVLTNGRIATLCRPQVEDIVEDSIEFADESPLPPSTQLLENVFADPKGFGIHEDGGYRYEKPGFFGGDGSTM